MKVSERTYEILRSVLDEVITGKVGELLDNLVSIEVGESVLDVVPMTDDEFDYLYNKWEHIWDKIQNDPQIFNKFVDDLVYKMLEGLELD